MTHPIATRPRTPAMTSPRSTRLRLADHVDRFASEHPPIPIASVDFTIRDPRAVAERFGGVLDYMARTELEVERNVLELTTLLPDPPEIDRRFYAEVWGPQERQHGLILDTLQTRLGMAPTDADLTTVSTKIRVLGLLAHLTPIQDVVRMLYYLTGMTTERSALIAYQRLHDGAKEMTEKALAASVIAPIRRQEPGHYAYYQFAARQLWDQLAHWQRWLVRRLRALSFSPVGAGDRHRRAEVGRMIIDLDLGDPASIDALAEQVARVETELLGAGRRGLRVPPYIVGAFRDAVALAGEPSSRA
ncbi:MAG: GTP-binding protein LepA [Nocardioides sp.]|uniref:GTP-binding protein LepA n=1 Tax=Nocardioides sp. TaxID=35761 RepID=UPI0039E5545F